MGFEYLIFLKSFSLLNHAKFSLFSMAVGFSTEADIMGSNAGPERRELICPLFSF